MAESPVIAHAFWIFVFLALLSVISYWVGGLTLDSVLLIALTIGGVVYLHRRYSHSVNSIFSELPLLVWVTGLILVGLTSYSLLFIHPYYDASADPLHTMNVRVLANSTTLPDTYAPYSDVPLSYPLGFHLAMVPLVRGLSFIPDYQILWAAGLLFVFFYPIFLYYFLHKLTANSQLSSIAVLLLLGTKTIFYNVFTGLYPWLLAADLVLLAWLFSINRHPLAFVFWPAVFVVHPAIGAYGVAAYVLYIFFFNQTWRAILPIVGGLVIALPALPAYLATFNTSFGTNLPGSGMVPAVSMAGLAKLSYLLIPWIGIVPVGLAVVSIILGARNYFIHSRRVFYFFAANIIVAGIAFLFFAAKGSALDNKMVEWATVAALGIFASTGHWVQRIPKELLQYVPIILAALCLIFFFTASTITHYRMGSKIDADGAAFAAQFKELDDRPARVFYFSKYPAKISQYSNKIPYDITQQYFVSLIGIQHANYEKDPVAVEAYSRAALRKKILDENCFTCALETDSDYVVVDSRYYALNSSQEPLLRVGAYSLYSTKGRT